MSNVTKDDKFAELLKLYIELDEWCRDHDIKVFLDWGTLLGAVRHGGFIPWDFDLDVAILWDDYQKLIAQWDIDPLPDRELVNIYRYDTYPSLFTRIIDTTTTEIRVASAWDLGPCGMSVDIFPLFPLPKDQKAKDEAEDLFLVYYELKNPMMVNKGTRRKSMLKSLKHYRRLSKIIGRERVCKKLEKKVFSTPQSECEYFMEMTAGSRRGCIFSKALIGDFTEIEFEGHMSYVPEHYIEMLQYVYGGGWRYFPKNRFTDTGYQYVENMHIEYPVYVKDYMQLFDKEQIIAERTKAKYKSLSVVPTRNEIVKDYYIAKSEPMVIKVESFGSPSEFQDEMPDELRSLLLKYAYTHVHDKFKYWQIRPSLSDAWNALVCKALFEANELDTLLAYSNLLTETGRHGNTPEMVYYKSLVEYNFELRNALDYENVEKVRTMYAKADEFKVAELLEDISEMFLMLHDDSFDKDAFCKLADEYFEKYSSNWEVCRYHAYALAISGNADEAKSEYERIIESANDGMAIQWSKRDMEALEIG